MTDGMLTTGGQSSAPPPPQPWIVDWSLVDVTFCAFCVLRVHLHVLAEKQAAEGKEFPLFAMKTISSDRRSSLSPSPPKTVQENDRYESYDLAGNNSLRLDQIGDRPPRAPGVIRNKVKGKRRQQSTLVVVRAEEERKRGWEVGTGDCLGTSVAVVHSARYTLSLRQVRQHFRVPTSTVYLVRSALLSYRSSPYVFQDFLLGRCVMRTRYQEL
jgi:hypothetical protein